MCSAKTPLTNRRFLSSHKKKNIKQMKKYYMLGCLYEEYKKNTPLKCVYACD